MRLPKILAASTALLGCYASAQAPYRCDCTSIVDTCSAEVTAHGTFLEIKTDSQQCARVDYFVEGQPFVSMVVDGEDRENWLARTTNPRILVQSCQVCRDSGASATATTPPRSVPAPTATPSAADAPGEGGLRLLIASVPEYPAAAAARGLRGYVEVEFTVTPAGRVENAHVIAAEPRDMFDTAALAAVQRRRYTEDTTREAQTLTERIEFQPPRPGSSSTELARSGPLNQCVREEAVYNFGETIDVGLINTCAEPLYVFGCALGTGKDLGTWVCSNSEQRGYVLVPTGDARLGRRFGAGDAADFRTYTYTDTYSVTRAPNSQYWWVACSEGDAACRSAARLWTRAVSGQDARLDPQTRSLIAVASSD